MSMRLAVADCPARLASQWPAEDRHQRSTGVANVRGAAWRGRSTLVQAVTQLCGERDRVFLRFGVEVGEGFGQGA